jgi:hypothetical protein
MNTTYLAETRHKLYYAMNIKITFDKIYRLPFTCIHTPKLMAIGKAKAK